MRATQILQPLDGSFSQTKIRELKTIWKDISDKLNDLKDGPGITFEQLLEDFNVSEENYLHAI